MHPHAQSRSETARFDEPDGRGRLDAVRPSVATLMLRWQEAGRHDDFTAVVECVFPELERVAAATLCRRGVRDPAAVDDAVSLALDHLRRLAGSGPDEPPVAKFSIDRATRTRPTDDDPGRVYVRQLGRARALDVVRSRTRSRILSLSQIPRADEQTLKMTSRGVDEAASPAGLADGLRGAVHLLEPRQRTLVEMLLDGKSQAVIAHVLGVCEGTVSRLRAKALESLRRILAETP